MIDEKKLIEEIDNRVQGLTNIQINKIADIINEQPKVGDWIPCSERLPEGCEDAEIEVLVTVKEEYPECCFDNVTGFALYYPGDKKFHSVYTRIDITDIVIAWMPLPEPIGEK